MALKRRRYTGIFVWGLCLGWLLFGFSPRVYADSARAKALYSEGLTFFNLGRYEQAVKAWEEGYREKPDAQFLFNLGQAHRLAGDAEKALLFYRNFLREKPDASNRADVEQKIVALDTQVEMERRAALVPPPMPASNLVQAEAENEQVNSSAMQITSRDKPAWGNVGVALGMGGWTAGGSGASLAISGYGRAVVARPWHLTKLELGVRANLARYSDDLGDASLWSFLLTPSLSRSLTERVEVSAEFGFGVASLFGAKPGSKVLRDDIVSVQGGLSTFAVRPEVRAAFAWRGGYGVFASAAYAAAVGRQAYFSSGLNRVELLVGFSFAIGGRS